MPSRTNLLTGQRVALYCQVRLKPFLASEAVEQLSSYLQLCLLQRQFPPYRGSSVDVSLIAESTGLDREALRNAQRDLQPICDAICRSLADQPLKEPRRVTARHRNTGKRQTPLVLSAGASRGPADYSSTNTKQRRGPKPRPIEMHPEPLWQDWEDPAAFADALTLHMRRHDETVYSLAKAVTTLGPFLDRQTLAQWINGTASPQSTASLEAVAFIEKRYRLPAGSLRSKLPHPSRAPRSSILQDIPLAERRRLAWHLPDDFGKRPVADQEEILDWVRTTIISGSTDYRRYQSVAQKQRFAVRFRGPDGARK